MSSNLPPGVSENTFGAPYNDEEFEFTLEVTIGGSLQGPLSEEEYDEQVEAIKAETKRQIYSEIDNILNISEI